MSLFAGTELYRAPRCDRCGLLETECQCPPAEATPWPPDKQTAIVRVERRKRGQTVTVISGLGDGTPLPHLKRLLKSLKEHLGTGGRVDETNLELQGDHQERLVVRLKQLGYRIG